MATKRFTDPAIWKQNWWVDLKPKQKILWNYINDQCDSVGLWPISLKTATFFIGDTIEEADLEALGIGTRIEFIDKDTLWIPSFIKFQYTNLNIKNQAHRGMIKNLIKSVGHLKLTGESKLVLDQFKEAMGVEGLETLSRGSPEGQERVDRPSTDLPVLVQVLVQEEEECEEKEISAAKLFAMWNEYCASLPKAEKLTDKRKSRAKAQIKKYQDPVHWLSVLDRWKASDFCISQWKPTFDDWLNENKRVSTLEGRYDNRAGPPSKIKASNEWEPKARLVLDGIRLCPPGKTDELRHHLGEELFQIALKVPGGISAIRKLPADDFTVRKLSGMLQGVCHLQVAT